MNYMEVYAGPKTRNSQIECRMICGEAEYFISVECLPNTILNEEKERINNKTTNLTDYLSLCD